jgi:methyl-accepting chemotaxis protein
MSGNAAREITSILGESIQKVEGIVEQTKSRVDSLVGENKSKVSDGVQIAKECGGVLDEIVGSISKLNEMASSISSASQEQAQGVREITQAMSQLDEATQHNASSSEEAAQAAARLTAQASSLQSIIDSLTESIYGTHKTRGFMKGLFSKASTSKPSKSSALPSVSAEARHELVSFGPKKSAASRDELKGPIAEVIPLPTKSSSASVSNEGPTLKLKTAAVGTVSSFPSPDDERFKDV